ncbi:MAG: hypothetical protein RQ760_13365 [Sedimentisphaerales bacterium]|nr:hypothetical protein [Sedimentisphaerales bacterium]
MYYSLAQIIVIARGNDDGWINILVMVVLAAVYGLSALIKAKGKQPEDQSQEQQTRKPQRKPSSGGGGILEQIFREIQQAAEGKSTQETRPSGQATRKNTARPQAAIRKYAAETKQARQTQSTSAPAKSKLVKPTPQAQRDFGNSAELDKGIRVLPDITTKVVNLSDKCKRIPSQSEESSYLSEVLFDHENPDQLKRAILYYEILGKPLALRDPGENIIGL